MARDTMTYESYDRILQTILRRDRWEFTVALVR